VRVAAHTFRHTFARFYLERGGELFDLSREMGHSTVTVTEVYLRDYHSTQARKQHSTHSPVDLVDIAERQATSAHRPDVAAAGICHPSSDDACSLCGPSH
jgi:hypothetical protein